MQRQRFQAYLIFANGSKLKNYEIEFSTATGKAKVSIIFYFRVYRDPTATFNVNYNS
jgi:hypothetical protein